MKWQQALMPLCLAAPVGAQAAPRPSAVRVALGGETRIVRSLGQPTDSEFYAPITKSLRALWLDVQESDLGDLEVRYQGNRVARWPVVSSKERLPDDATHPTALRDGDDLLVPVRAVVALGNGWIDWDDHTRTLTITPTVRRIELLQGEHGMEVRLEASAPVKVTCLQLTRPARLAVDITPAWFKVAEAPRPVGPVRSVRLGQFTRDTARLALELTGGPVRITGLPQSGTVITARVESAEGVKITRSPLPDDRDRGGPSSLNASAIDGAPATASPSRTPLFPPVRPRGGRFSVRRGLASRGGFVRRDQIGIIDSDGGPLTGKVICIDPGHGGWKFGASGQNGLQEGTACLGMAQQLAAALRESGATVLMTREADQYVSLEERWGFANNQHVDLFISIHCNAMAKRGTMTGSETYYCTPQSMELARSLHAELVRAMAGRDGGIRRRNFAVIRHTTMPSVLLEVGYIDNTGDETKLGDPAFQAELGKALRDGVVRYFGG